MLDPATITVIISSVVGALIALIKAIVDAVKEFRSNKEDNSLGLKKV